MNRSRAHLLPKKFSQNQKLWQHILLEQEHEQHVQGQAQRDLI